MSSQGPKEELLGLLPLSGQTRGEDITNAVQNCLEDNKIDLNKIVAIATDGAQNEFVNRVEQFKTSKATLAFIVNPLNTNSYQIHIEPFGIDTGSKALWNGTFTQLKSKLEELEAQKCMYVTQQKWTALEDIQRVEALIFDAWNSLSDYYSKVKKLAFGVRTILRSTSQASVLLHEYN
ncbi:hypothetical protein QE152_g30801 [Popillia japonica]|uniref:VWFA domain-containing protein n=1 Tax=Popillia japonica TaxID=7064 RepID=A0AAW1JDM6_POPJA